MKITAFHFGIAVVIEKCLFVRQKLSHTMSVTDINASERNRKPPKTLFASEGAKIISLDNGSSFLTDLPRW